MAFVLVQRFFTPQSGGLISKSAHPNGAYKLAGPGQWAQQNRIADAMDQPRRDDLDTTVTGPWLKRWSDGS